MFEVWMWACRARMAPGAWPWHVLLPALCMSHCHEHFSLATRQTAGRWGWIRKGCGLEFWTRTLRSIPATVILPELEVGEIESLKDLTRECRVDAAAASGQKRTWMDRAVRNRPRSEHGRAEREERAQFEEQATRLPDDNCPATSEPRRKPVN